MDDQLTPSALRARGGLKWTFHPEGVLAAWVAEMDFGIAPAVTEALGEAVARGDIAYPYPDLERAAAEAACGFWEDRFGWKVSPDRVFSTPDVVEGLRRAIVHLTPSGSSVVLHTPVYYPFFSMVERAGRRLVEVPCRPDAEGRYRLDLDGIARELGEGAGSVVLCNPWNPTGRSFSREELEEVIDLAAARSARVISDEVHGPLTRGGTEHLPAASLAPETVVTVTSASKAWNLPGLKCAQVVLTNERDVETWSDYFTMDKVGVGTLGLVANAAAYSDGRDWLDDVTMQLDSNQQLLDELMADHLPDVGYSPPQGTYLAWLDFRRYDLEDPAGYLLERAGVALSSGTPFGVGGSGHARLNFATAAPILTRIVERMGAALS